MKTTGFLRVSRRIAPGISIGTVMRGRSAGFWALLALLAASGRRASRPAASPQHIPVGAHAGDRAVFWACIVGWVVMAVLAVSGVLG